MSLHIFSKQTKIDFVGMRHYAYGLSALLILVGLITIFTVSYTHLTLPTKA